MRNHWHFIVWPKTDDDVSTFFHELTTAHAKLWRRLTRTVGRGHVYQDRYKAFPIHTEAYFLTAMRYVEGNAFRARLVDSARHWRWSSLQERTGYDRGILDESPVELPANWIESVDTALPDQVLRNLRKRSRKY
jgi:putative transposase